ncbi:MAG: DUF1080 domain-containing protein [Pirellulaceae bacterium]
MSRLVRPRPYSLLALFALLGMLSLSSATHAAKPEKASLFNGKDLTGWRVDVPELDENPDKPGPFRVREGLLVSLGQPRGHLITEKTHKNYRLEVEYRFAGKPGNCGVLVPGPCTRCFPSRLRCR